MNIEDAASLEKKMYFVKAYQLQMLNYDGLQSAANLHSDNINIKHLSSLLRTSVLAYDKHLQDQVLQGEYEADPAEWVKVQNTATKLSETIEEHKRDLRDSTLESNKYKLTRFQIIWGIAMPAIVSIAGSISTNVLFQKFSFEKIENELKTLNTYLSTSHSAQPLENSTQKPAK